MNATARALLAKLPEPVDADDITPVEEAELAIRLFRSPIRHARPPRESDLLAHATRDTIAGGVARQSWGDRRAPATLLVHGWEGRGAQLGAFVRPLVSANRSVLTFDGPAHGDSPGTQTNIVEFAQAVAASTAPPVQLDSVVAHSFGGPVTAFAIAREGLRPRRLVLMSGPDSLEGVLRRFRDFLGISPDAFELFRAGVRKIGGVTGDDFRISDVLRKLGAPVLIVHAPDDEEVPFAEAEAIVANCPTATLLRAEGCNHRKVLYAPEIVAAVTDFLTRPA
jgi:pimeloyl-ACP methyl ester carboxylesterase